MNFNYQHDGYKSMGIPMAPVSMGMAPPSMWHSSLEKPKMQLQTPPQQFFQNNSCQFPTANLSHMTNFAFLQSTPDETINQCIEYLTERSMTNFTQMPGGVVGYFFQNNSHVKFNLSIKVREQNGEDYLLHAMRMNGDAFVFNDFWRGLLADLEEKQLIEADEEESDASWAMDFIQFSDDEDDMDIDLNQDQYLKFTEDTDTVKFMIDDMKDPSFRESCAATLAYNCANQDNRIVVLAFGQELFDALIACIFCSLATCYYVQLPFYRSAAMLLDTMFDNQAVQMVSSDQYEALVAATKSWSVQSQQNQGEITNSEEIATILSRQLVRCAPRTLTDKAHQDLQEMERRSQFKGVRKNVLEALRVVQ